MLIEAAGPVGRAVDILVLLAAVAAVFTASALAGAGFLWGLPSASHVQSYHPDEQNVTYSLRNMDPAHFDFNPQFFGNPIFFTYQVGALALAASAVGILPRETGEEYWLTHPGAVRSFYILGRALSFVYALLAAFALYALTRRVSDSPRAALLAVLIFVSLPVTAVHSHYMTVNASAVFYSLMALLFALKIQETPLWRHYVLAGVFAGLAISTKLNNALLPFAIFAAHMTAPCKGARWKSIFSRKIVTAAFVTAAAFFVGSPYYVLDYASVAANPHNQMNMTALADFSTALSVVFRDFANHMTAACGWAFAALLIIALPAAPFVLRKRSVPLVAVALPFLLIGVKSGWWAFPSRLWPLLAVLTVCLATMTAVKTAWLRYGVAVLVAAGLVSTVVWNAAYLGLTSGRHVREESSDWILRTIPQGETIIVLDTPYFDDPNLVYEVAVHGRYLSPQSAEPVHYDIENLKGRFDLLPDARGSWFVVPQRFEPEIEKRGSINIPKYAAGNGFTEVTVFKRDFTAFGVTLRDWVPADMVQDYPVYIFLRIEPRT